MVDSPVIERLRAIRATLGNSERELGDVRQRTSSMERDLANLQAGVVCAWITRAIGSTGSSAVSSWSIRRAKRRTRRHTIHRQRPSRYENPTGSNRTLWRILSRFLGGAPAECARAPVTF